MTLAELLDELRQNLLRDSSTLKSGPPDHFWSDVSLVRYIEEAHRRFARRSLCLQDDVTPDATQVVLQNAVQIYTLDASVLRVKSARHQDATTDLVRITHNIRFSTVNDAVDFVDGVIDTGGSIPLRFATDEGVQVDDNHQVRMLFDPIPDSTQVGKIVYLRVVRLPLVPLSVDKMDASPEIPGDWHLDMLEWAAYRALRNWDVDGENRAKAEQHKTRFEEAVTECKRELRAMQMFEPVKWAFGQAGFGGYGR